MVPVEQDAVVVPFGTDRWSWADLGDRAAARPRRAAAPFPCLLLPADHDGPLRLNNIPADLFAGATAPIDRAEPLTTLHTRLLALCDPWNNAASTFVARYFRAIEAAVLAHAAEIAAGACGLGRLFEPRDWAYSAPCPLPRAHLRAPGGAGGPPEADYVAVDFAFWSGAGFIALDVAPSRLLPVAARDRRRRLADAGIVLIDRAPADDPAAWLAFFGGLLAPPLTTFWQGEAVPLGPFASDALDALDGMVLGH